MAKLYFKYGTMGCGKSVDLLKTAYNYEERNQNVLLLTSSLDDRSGIGKITTRIGLNREALIIKPSDNILNIYNTLEKQPDIIICDESQFFTEKQVEQLSIIVDVNNIPVICYGLRTDFQSQAFEGSKRLLELADKIEEIKTMCWCGKKAIMNARIVDNKITYKGEKIQIGGNESYISLCRKHYFNGKLREDN